MRLHDEDGARLYLNKEERNRFVMAARALADKELRAFCTLLHDTGCRPTEALELVPKRILLDEKVIVIRTLKKRRKDRRGRIKKPQYRQIPVPDSLIDLLDLVFDVRTKNKKPGTAKNVLWDMHRSTAWRVVKKVMAEAKIEGKQATCKGLRHGFGIAMVTGEYPLLLHTLADIMGHSSSATTEIYTKALGGEKRDMVMRAWRDK